MIDTNTLETTTQAKEPTKYTNTHTQLAAIHKYKYIYVYYTCNTEILPKIIQIEKYINQRGVQCVDLWLTRESHTSHQWRLHYKGENIPRLFVLSQIQEQSRQDTKYETQERQNTKQTGDSERRG